VGSLLVGSAFILLGKEFIKLNLYNKYTFWAAVIIEAIGLLIYVVHLFLRSLPILDVLGFLFLVAAFVLLCMGQIIKRH
jgi:hypothetical protein